MRHFLLSWTLFLCACGGMVSDAGDGGDASASDVVVATDAPLLLDGGPTCNDLTPIWGIPVQAVPQDAPPIAAGDPPPPPGTYALESVTLYTGHGGASGNVGNSSVMLRIESDRTTYQVASSQDGQLTLRQTFQLGKSGNGYALTATCGGHDATPISFPPINSTGFALRAGSGHTTSIEVFRPLTK